jgi:hypothetical protein
MATEMTEMVVTGGAAAAGSTALLTFMFFALRKMIRVISSDSVTTVQETAQKSTVNTLREEVSRLEGLVTKMQLRVETFEKKFDAMRSILVDAQVTLIDAEMLVARCDCESADEARAKLAEVRKKLLETEF